MLEERFGEGGHADRLPDRRHITFDRFGDYGDHDTGAGCRQTSGEDARGSREAAGAFQAAARYDPGPRQRDQAPEANAPAAQTRDIALALELPRRWQILLQFFLDDAISSCQIAPMQFGGVINALKLSTGTAIPRTATG